MGSEAKSPINVAIIGAGIGGLALAIGLLRQNVPYTLYESAAAYSMVGAGVGLGPNAQRGTYWTPPNHNTARGDIVLQLMKNRGDPFRVLSWASTDFANPYSNGYVRAKIQGFV